jgi:hypothetical protein
MAKMIDRRGVNTHKTSNFMSRIASIKKCKNALFSCSGKAMYIVLKGIRASKCCIFILVDM